jgi:hypothetical protein
MSEEVQSNEALPEMILCKPKVSQEGYEPSVEIVVKGITIEISTEECMQFGIGLIGAAHQAMGEAHIVQYAIKMGSDHRNAGHLLNLYRKFCEGQRFQKPGEG